MLTASQKSVVYDSSKIRTRLGWMPRVSLSDALENLVSFERSRRSAQTRTTADVDNSAAA